VVRTQANGGDDMDARCRSRHDEPGTPLFGCLDCGTTCCQACAIHLESAIYCHACAGSLLEATQVQAAAPFELH
jgi:hypothetical protein